MPFILVPQKCFLPMVWIFMSVHTLFSCQHDDTCRVSSGRNLQIVLSAWYCVSSSSINHSFCLWFQFVDFVCLGGWGLCFAFFVVVVSFWVLLWAWGPGLISVLREYLSLIPWSSSGPSSQWLRSHATSLLYEESYLFSHLWSWRNCH